MKKILSLIVLLSFAAGCGTQSEEGQQKESSESLADYGRINPDDPFLWENANVYFLMTDRFYNGNTENDIVLDRTSETALLRGFEGGDIAGITQKINDGYFNDLGINAIWFTPIVEQIHGIVDEGTGNTYGFHGYWAKDWTSLDPNFGTEDELASLVEAAHAKGIRVLLDVVINHTGPVTDSDPIWPEEWVRSEPTCKYDTYEATVSCTLTDNLPDIKTESNEEVELPEFLVEKWKAEGRYEQEVKELDEFFASTGYPRAPRFYIIKWLVDYIKKYGVDGFRVDTVKHTEASIWAELYEEAFKAFEEWKKLNPDKVMDGNSFYTVGEVYGYGVSGVRMYSYGDQEVDFFDNGFDAMINFQFKSDAGKSYEEIFSSYSQILQDGLSGKSILNYISSHDDGGPFDKMREKPMESGTKLLLTPGGSQVYYGDESARSLDIPGTEGDATLRSFMNWDQIEGNAEVNGFMIQDVLAHWQKLGRFRRDHLSVGAGVHEMISEDPYLFKRTYTENQFSDKVVVGLDLEAGEKSISVEGVFENGTQLKDYYSDQNVVVEDGKVSVDSEFGIVLLAESATPSI